MIKVRGRVSEALIYTDVVEDEAIKQIERLCDR